MIQAVSAQVRRLRDAAAARDALRGELSALQPKVQLVARMRQQLVALQERVDEIDPIAVSKPEGLSTVTAIACTHCPALSMGCSRKHKTVILTQHMCTLRAPDKDPMPCQQRIVCCPFPTSPTPTPACQARIAVLTSEADKLPALQAQLRRAQASAGEVKVLEAKLAEYERMQRSSAAMQVCVCGGGGLCWLVIGCVVFVDGVI